MFASFSYAGFFPPAESMDGTWFDGSVIWDLDIFSAVNKCLETHDQKNITVHVLLTSEKTLKVVDASKFNSLEMGIRYLEVSRYYGHMDGLLRAQFAYPNVNFVVIGPSEPLASAHLPLNLTTEQVQSDIQIGVQDGAAIPTPQDTENLFHFFSLKKKLDQRVKGIKYDQFLQMKSEGVFQENYNLLEDQHMRALFLQ